MGVRGGPVGLGTPLQILILPATLWLWGRLRLEEKQITELSPGE